MTAEPHILITSLTVKEFTVKVLQNELPFDEAYRQLWEDSNLRRSSQMQLRPKR
jgi:hypothetical protein